MSSGAERNNVPDGGTLPLPEDPELEEKDVPFQLLNEFQSLYSEKIRKIEEKCGSPNAKIKVLEAWISDLTEQNRVLMKAVLDLEKEAEKKIDKIDELAKAAQESLEEDVKSDLCQLLEMLKKIRERKPYCPCCFKFKTITYMDIFGCPSPPKTFQCAENHCCSESSFEDVICTKSDLPPKYSTYKRSERQKFADVSMRSNLENRLSQLQEDSKSCEKEMAELREELKMRSKECETLKTENQRIEQIACKLEEVECDLRAKTMLIEKLEEENHKSIEGSRCSQDKLDEVSVKLEQLNCEVETKNAKIQELESCLQERESSSSTEVPCHSLQAELKAKNKELTELKKNRDRNLALLQNLRHQVDSLQEENLCLRSTRECYENQLQEYACREQSLKLQICELGSNEKQLIDRAKELETYVTDLEVQLECMQNAAAALSEQEINKKMEYLKEALKEKECELNRHIDEEQRLQYEIKNITETFQKREDQLRDAYLNISCELKMKKDEISRMINENPHKTKQIETTQQLSSRIGKGECDVDKLKFQLKDMQKVLTGEIADKHDEIRRLKDDIKELEDKLRQSEKQTHFRDDLIKELRKQVKHGRAKESLAEMLGLKGTPRATMKTKIENMTNQIEELKSLNISLEARLAECNLPAVLTLRSRLNQAEGSLLAMCNKIDYVRRYLENLKGDEELSLKCGIEALLNELRDDVEWNRQTRRNLSLDEGTSVIVISHRSRSLPDNSLHRMPCKSPSDTAVPMLPNKPTPPTIQLPMEGFQECKTYIKTINELENNFDETYETLSKSWTSLKHWSEGSGDLILKGFGEIIRSSVEGNEELARLGTQVGSLLDYKEEESGNHMEYLEGNLIELGDYLTKANLLTPSDMDLEKKDQEKTDELGVLSKRITMIISDSVSLLYDMKKRNISHVPLYVKGCLQDMMVLFSSIIGNQKTVLEKLVSLQKNQIQFVQSLVEKVSTFNKGLSSYSGLAEHLKGEIRKLFSALLTKETEIGKQFDEIQYLKSLLSSTTNNNEKQSNEVSSLRKVVSNKDLKTTEKEELIHNLRCLNYTLRRTKISRSSPSINCSVEVSEDLDCKLQDLDETLVTIKGNLSSILMYLLRNQDKMSEFEDKSRSLIQTLAQTHQEIMSCKDAISDGKGDAYNITSLDGHLNEATVKVEQLLTTVEVFLCDGEKPDLSIITETLRKKMVKLAFVGDLIKKSALHENSLIKTIADENEDLKKQMKDLEEQLSEDSTYSKGLSSEEDNSLIQELRENLEKANATLISISKEYSNLKIQKEDMETKNQKVMEELQAKISVLQEAASHAQPSETFDEKEAFMKNMLLRKENELSLSKKEVCDLVNIVNKLREENVDLQTELDKSKEFIQFLKELNEERKVEIENLEKCLREMKSISELLGQEVDNLRDEKMLHTEKIEEMQRTEAALVENCSKLTQELESIKSYKLTLEDSMLAMRGDLVKKTDEATYCQQINNKLKENLTKNIEENRALQMQHELDQRQKDNLEKELEKVTTELKELRDREVLINGELIEKRQHIYQLNLEKQKLLVYIREIETVVKEKMMSEAEGDKSKEEMVEKQSRLIEVLTAQLNQMSHYIAEKDEIINLIEQQLRAGTQFMLEESEPAHPAGNPGGDSPRNSLSGRLEHYKVRLQQAMQQNCRLVNMVHKLQHINYTILSYPRDTWTSITQQCKDSSLLQQSKRD